MKKILPLFVLGTTLTACTGSLIDALPDNRPNYKTSRTGNLLEVPPDLTQSSIDSGLAVAELSATDKASLAAYQGERSSSTNSTDRLESALKNIHSTGDATWIELDAKPGDVFKRVKNFWLDNGLALSRSDANIGIMETDWLQRQANLPTSGISAILSRMVSGLQDDGIRDKFRTRIDYDGKHSYVYLTHYGASEQVIDRNGRIVTSHTQKSKDDSLDFTWVADSRNPELEVEMLRKLNLYLQKRGQSAVANEGTDNSAKPTLTTLSDGTPVLVIDSNFDNAWRLLGVAIDRSDFGVISQNRQKGFYRFEKITERRVGFIIKRTERDIENYEIGLADQGKQQIAVLRSHNNTKPSKAEAQAILQKIAQAISF